MIVILRKFRFLYFLFGGITVFLFYKFSTLDSLFPNVIKKNDFYDEFKCGCPRYSQSMKKSEESSFCSDGSTSRGKNQSVISYTLYGNYENKHIWAHYYNQFERRLEEVNKYYDGWTVRLYHNFSQRDEIVIKFLCDLYCKYPNLDLCDVKKIQVPNSWLEEIKSTYNDSSTPVQAPLFQKILEFANSHKTNADEKFEKIKNGENLFGNLLPGKLWRFLPLGDSFVSKFLVRDVDSFILEREVAAVNEWLKDYGTLIHAMRDHPSHNGLILAGMWGAIREKDEKKLIKFLMKMVITPVRDVWDYDQILLRRFLWPEVVNQIVLHDSYYCKSTFLTNKGNIILPYPTQRKGKMFVSWGPTRSKGELDALKPCPSACRPKNHQDWEYC
ncbi:UNVERIFIED_CONTAM: hypothetical protein RMT77_012661 [Armadillidium vulgare]